MPRSLPRLRLPYAAILLLALVGACARDEGQVINLADGLYLAEFRPETGLIDVGTPEARAQLQDGWLGRDERWLNGERDFVWGTGDRSRVRFFSYRDRGRTLRLTGRPFMNDGRPAPTLKVVVNGSPIDEVVLERGFNDYEVRIAPEIMRQGENILDLYYERDLRGVPDRYEDLSVAWDRIRVGRPWEYGQPRAVTGTAESEQSLVVPFYSRLDYYLALQPGHRLEIGPITVDGRQVRQQGASLQISVEGENGERLTRRIPAEEFSARQQIDLEITRATVGRVSILAEIEFDPRRESGLRIDAPRIVGPTPQVDAPPAARLAEMPTTGSPNVLVYLIDTLRADHLGLYGYDLDTSPRIDAFARAAVTFDHAYTQSGWTRSSVASIVTGMVPTAHGVLERNDALPAEAPAIAEEFQQLGYRTFGITTNGNVSSTFGFDRGFDTYLHMGERKTVQIHQPSEAMHARFLRWLDEAEGDRPFFVYLHSSDPHGPYTPRSPFSERFPAPGRTDILQPHLIPEALAADPTLTLEELRSEFVPRYDGEIAYNDHTFGQLLDALQDRGLYDDTIIVLVADHGEEFLDHGRWGHGKTLFTENIRTPLLIKLPAQRSGGTRTQALTQHVDLLPTLLELVGGTPPSGIQGSSRVEVLRDPENARGADWVRSYLQLDGHSLASIITDGHHLIRPLVRPDRLAVAGSLLFNLDEDMFEQRNLASRRPLRAGYLLTQIHLLEGADTVALEAGAAEVDEALVERLRALGYLQ